MSWDGLTTQAITRACEQQQNNNAMKSWPANLSADDISSYLGEVGANYFWWRRPATVADVPTNDDMSYCIVLPQHADILLVNMADSVLAWSTHHVCHLSLVHVHTRVWHAPLRQPIWPTHPRQQLGHPPPGRVASPPLSWM